MDNVTRSDNFHKEIMEFEPLRMNELEELLGDESFNNSSTKPDIKYTNCDRESYECESILNRSILVENDSASENQSNDCKVTIKNHTNIDKNQVDTNEMDDRVESGEKRRQTMSSLIYSMDFQPLRMHELMELLEDSYRSPIVQDRRCYSNEDVSTECETSVLNQSILVEEDDFTSASEKKQRAFRMMIKRDTKDENRGSTNVLDKSICEDKDYSVNRIKSPQTCPLNSLKKERDEKENDITFENPFSVINRRKLFTNHTFSARKNPFMCGEGYDSIETPVRKQIGNRKSILGEQNSNMSKYDLATSYATPVNKFTSNSLFHTPKWTPIRNTNTQNSNNFCTFPKTSTAVKKSKNPQNKIDIKDKISDKGISFQLYRDDTQKTNLEDSKTLVNEELLNHEIKEAQVFESDNQYLSPILEEDSINSKLVKLHPNKIISSIEEKSDDVRIPPKKNIERLFQTEENIHDNLLRKEQNKRDSGIRDFEPQLSNNYEDQHNKFVPSAQNEGNTSQIKKMVPQGENNGSIHQNLTQKKPIEYISDPQSCRTKHNKFVSSEQNNDNMTHEEQNKHYTNEHHVDAQLDHNIAKLNKFVSPDQIDGKNHQNLMYEERNKRYLSTHGEAQSCHYTKHNKFVSPDQLDNNIYQNLIHDGQNKRYSSTQHTDARSCHNTKHDKFVSPDQIKGNFHQDLMHEDRNKRYSSTQHSEARSCHNTKHDKFMSPDQIEGNFHQDLMHEEQNKRYSSTQHSEAQSCHNNTKHNKFVSPDQIEDNFHQDLMHEEQNKRYSNTQHSVARSCNNTKHNKFVSPEQNYNNIHQKEQNEHYTNGRNVQTRLFHNNYSLNDDKTHEKLKPYSNTHHVDAQLCQANNAKHNNFVRQDQHDFNSNPHVDNQLEHDKFISPEENHNKNYQMHKQNKRDSDVRRFVPQTKIVSPEIDFLPRTANNINNEMVADKIDVISHRIPQNSQLPAEGAGQRNSEALNKRVKNFKTLFVKGREYILISKLGEGGSCQVFDCLEPQTLQHCAIKIVNLAVDAVSASGYVNEVKMLKSLQGSEYVIKILDYEISNNTLFVVMEKGGIDLSVFLRNIANNSTFLPFHVINYYWMEMLNCVKEIHDAGIIHSDLKPSNFLIVDGRLKLIDFGIASRLSSDMTSVIKNVQVGTFNYISPEALLDSRGGDSPVNDGKPRIKISYKSDVWSLGCILYQLVYRKTPFHNIGNTLAKISIIVDPKHTIQYPAFRNIPAGMQETISKCLQYDMRKRPTVSELISLYNSTIC